MDPYSHSELISYVELLGQSDQAKVVAFARQLAESSKRGVAGTQLIQFAGSISAEDAAEMIQAIGEGCEQIDVSGW